jgi:hypothetical protein
MLKNEKKSDDLLPVILWRWFLKTFIWEGFNVPYIYILYICFILHPVHNSIVEVINYYPS